MIKPISHAMEKSFVEVAKIIQVAKQEIICSTEVLCDLPR